MPESLNGFGSGFETDFRDALKSNPPEREPPPRSQEDMLQEVLTTVRELCPDGSHGEPGPKTRLLCAWWGSGARRSERYAFPLGVLELDEQVPMHRDGIRGVAPFPNLGQNPSRRLAQFDWAQPRQPLSKR